MLIIDNMPTHLNAK